MESALLAALLWGRDKVDHSRYHRWCLTGYRWLSPFSPSPAVATTAAGIRFPSLIGAAAGIDPLAEHVSTLRRLGFGFLELGSITMDREVRQRPAELMDFTSGIITKTAQDSTCGAYQFCRNMKKGVSDVLVGANLIPSTEVLLVAPYLADKEYTNLIEVVYPYVDYIVANICCDGVKDLSQYRSEPRLRALCKELIRSRDIEIGLQCALEMHVSGVTVDPAKRLIPPLFLKIDADWEDPKMLARVLIEEGIEGVVVAGTNRKGEGGKTVSAVSLSLLREIYIASEGRLVLIASGGIQSAEDVLIRLKNGASLIELYSAFWLQGPRVVQQISEELPLLLTKEGFKSVEEAVGVDVKRGKGLV